MDAHRLLRTLNSVFQESGISVFPESPSLSPFPGAALSLPAEAAGQSVVLDYTATGLSLRQHPLALLRAKLQAAGCHDTRRLGIARPGSFIRAPEIVLMPTRSGVGTSEGGDPG